MKKILMNNYVKGFVWALAFMFGLFALNSVASAQLINELAINPPSTDQPCEYVELKGTPGAGLANIYFVAVEGDGAGAGTADYVFAFSSETIGSNGILAIVAAAQCGSRVYPMESTIVQDSTLDGSNGLENGTISFLLVNSPTTAITQGTDYDTNNDGMLDALPNDATIVDAVSWTDGGSGDINYGGVVLDQVSGTPDACTRFPDDMTPNSVAAWYNGDLVDDGNGNATVTYSDMVRSANFPPDGVLTPGDVNVGTPAAPGDANADFDGDGITDYTVLRGSGGLTGGAGQLTWLISTNGSGAISGADWGLSSDTPTPEDFDGDGIDDIAVWRPGNPNEAAFYILQSSDSSLRVEVFGQTGDDPRVVADYDGDGLADPAVYRVNSGSQNFFFYRGSMNNPNGDVTFVPWGSGANYRANVGDYDGDGKADFCVHDPLSTFVLLRSSDSAIEYVPWGTLSDTIVPGDFDGDGMDDFCVVRDNSGQLEWYILERDGGGTGGSPIVWGLNTDSIAVGDYDGDGHQDVAVWRSSDGVFYILRSTDAGLQAFGWGTAGDIPAAGWFNHGP
ncbi:MAG: VCBS repeat-containing protein [Pyrinomonadaceae bacterium]